MILLGVVLLYCSYSYKHSTRLRFEGFSLERLSFRPPPTEDRGLSVAVGGEGSNP